MKKIAVNPGLCIRCGACYSIDPTHLEPNEDDISVVINPLVEDDDTNAVEAKEACPTGAVTLEDAEEEDKEIDLAD